MIDNALFSLVRGVILAGLAARGFAVRANDQGLGWDVARSYEPDQQGATTQPTVYLFKVGGDKRHGSPQQLDTWDDAAQSMTHFVSQQFETTLQASVLMAESKDPAAYTASDVLNMVADIMQTDEGTQQLRAAQVGILRVAEVRNPYNTNEASQYAAGPSFDFVLTYRRERVSTVPYVVSVDSVINRV